MSPSPAVPPLAPGFQMEGPSGGGPELPAAQIAGAEGWQGGRIWRKRDLSPHWGQFKPQPWKLKQPAINSFCWYSLPTPILVFSAQHVHPKMGSPGSRGTFAG